MASPAEGICPASANQKRMYVLDQLSAGGTEYNVPVAVRLQGSLEVVRLRQALAALIARHASLRTSFAIDGDEVIQKIAENGGVALPIRSAKTRGGVEAIRKSFIRLFDLHCAPLLRACLIRLETTEHVLLVDLHHIICDGVSVDILIEELGRLYDGHALNSQPVDYTDFALWQKSFAGTDEAAAQEKYWLDLLADDRPAADLPLDNPRKRRRSFDGDRVFVRPGRELTVALRALAAKNRVSMYMLLLAGYSVLLSKYTGQEDVLIGTLVAGRREPFRDVVGLFVNTLVLRSQPKGDLSFADYLKCVRGECLSAFENQDYQFEDLVDRLAPTRDLGRNPLFDTMFGALLQDERVSSYGGVAFSRYELGYDISKFDLSLTAIEQQDQELVLELEYCTELFRKDTIERMGAHYLRVLEEVVSNPRVRLSDVELLTAEETRSLADVRCVPDVQSVVELFEAQVRRNPSATAVSFGDEHLTYGELYERARALAARLATQGVGLGDLVGVLAATSIEMIVAVLGILEVGAAYLPIDPATPMERFRTIVADSRIATLVVHAESRQFEAPGLTTIVLGEEGGEDPAKPAGTPAIRGCDLAYAIYTSGSTGTPKAVMVSHAALSNYVTWAVRTYVGEAAVSFALHSPLHVDLTVTSIFAPLVSGGRIVIYRNDDALALMREIVDGDEVELLKVTPTHLSLLAEVMSDTSALRSIIVGGEDLKTSLAAKIHAGFAGRAAIFNEYGPTEATVGCTVHAYDPAVDTGSSVPIGKAIDNTVVFILDKYGKPVPAGVTGELYVAGTGLADGYLNKPQMTDERFVVNRLGSERVRMYRTGDLVRLLPNGELDYLGRNDDQVKIRGYRIELGEIEANLLRLPNVKEAVVLRRVDAAGDAYLCAWVVVDDGIPVEELRSRLAGNLPAHMIPTWFVLLDRLPVAPGGKVDKSALPDPQEAAGGARVYAAPRSKTEAAIVMIWEQVLGLQAVGIDDNFFDLGGQSLKATLMTVRVNRELRASLSLRDLFSHPTVRELAPLVARAEEDSVLVIERAAVQEHYPVSSAQKRLYILHALAPSDVQYNVPWAIGIEGSFDAARWEQAFRALIARHESLRTSFAIIDDEIVETIHGEAGFALETPAAAGTLQEQIERFVRPFDLRKAPLIRAAVVESGTLAHTLILDMHHIVSDGMSAPILLEELLALYEGRPLAPPPLQYKDYAAWQRAYASSEAVEAQGAYWAKVFEGELPVLNLPTDFARGAVQSFEGDVARFHVGAGTVETLKAIQRDCGATMHMMLLAAYTILLSKYAGQEDVIVGTPVAGRNHASLQRVVGMFVNTLAMRNRPAGELTFREFLQTVKSNALDAYSNQDYQFEELVDRLAIERDLSRNPLFDTVFAVLDGGGRTFSVDGLRMEMLDFEWKISKFDLTLLASEGDDGLDFELEYCTKLFRADTIERLGGHYTHLLQQIARNPDRRIADLDPLTDGERAQILSRFNGTDHPYPADRAVHAIFEEQAELHPDNVAVVCGAAALSYSGLNRRANQIARALVSRGVEREDVIGIMAAPSLEMIAGILGILKAGCAYLPMDRDCPADRGRVMLDDSGARIVLTAGGAEWRDSTREILDLHDERLYDGDGSNLGLAVRGHDLAYVIYTSGTTGVPKGVMIEHHSLNNLCAWHNAEFEVTPADRATKYARFSFDASVWEIFPYLQAGASLHMIDERIRLDLPRLNRYFEEHGITIAFLPTQVCELFMELDNRSLRVLLTGGDRLRRFRPKNYRVVNNYGPTESTVVTTSGPVAADDKIPIGRPIFNTRVYLLGKAGQLVPVGVPGELCVAGVGLARAYVNDPVQTAAKFVADPFGPNGRMYRTGDLARWLTDGTIEYIGRTDKQVKIRGCRIEPREIEAAILAHDAVRDAVVIAREDSKHNKFLCAYVVWHGQSRDAELRADLSRQLPDYMVPAFVVTVEQIPMNATGKVDLAKLPSPDGTTTAQRYVAPRSDAERGLADIWRRVLERERIGVYDNFFEIGGDSLRATVMLAKANREFSAAIALGAVFDHPTIAALAHCFDEVVHHETIDLKPLGIRPHYTTTSIQALLYTICSSVKGVEYNLPMAFELEGDLDVARLEEVFRKLIHRHESLRTSFHMARGQVVQVVSPTVDFAIDILEECGDGEIDETMRDFIRPFDLGKTPLVRVALVPMGPRRHMLLMDVHHLVSDGTSMGILFREMAALYAGQEPPPPAATYKDFAQWQREYLQTEPVRAQEAYWRGILTDTPPLLNLDIDYPRPAKFSFMGGRIDFQARPEVHAALKTLCARQGVTLYMLLLAAYEVLLSKYSRQEDMIVAAPTSGRYIADVQDVIGMFVDTHMVRSRPRSELRFDEFLQQVKTDVRGALENQQYQLWDMIIGYATQNGGKSPFSTVFIVQDQSFKAMDMPGLEVKERDPGFHVAKFELTLGAIEREGHLDFELEYSTDVYRRSTARRLSGHYLHLLEQIVADPARELRQLELMPCAEKEAMLRDFSGSRGESSAEGTVVERFEHQAETTPERIAVICDADRFSYDELNRRANRLARYLRAQGIGAGDLVALDMPPSAGMIVAMLAAWKAGAAYVPLSPAWPRRRADSVIARSGAKVVLNDVQSDGYDATNLNLPVDAGALAYMTFVADRGVMIEHRSLLDRCRWYIERFAVTPDDRSAKYGDATTSATIFEILPFLCTGAAVCIVPESAGSANEVFRENNITIAWLPAPLCERLASADDMTLRVLITSARNVRPSRTGAYELVRCTGWAESTEVVTCCTQRGDGRSAVIGKTIPNTEVYIIGHDSGLQPVGVTGELCVAGAGLARGDDLTAGRFIANPHVAGATMVRTGDAARWLHDGTLEWTGRVAEVNIDGHRVPLAEIERCLESQASITDAAVVFDDEDPLQQRLAAFIVLRAGLQPSPSFVPDVKSSLAQWLPPWMLPDTWMQVAAIPRDAEGRVTYEKLPLPERPAATEEDAYSPVVRKVVSIAEELLDVPHVAPDASLSDLGMSSLTAMNLVARVQEAFGVAPAACEVIAEPTVSRIAQRVEMSLGVNDNSFTVAEP